jgi:hypothetical protein
MAEALGNDGAKADLPVTARFSARAAASDRRDRLFVAIPVAISSRRVNALRPTRSPWRKCVVGWPSPPVRKKGKGGGRQQTRAPLPLPSTPTSVRWIPAGAVGTVAVPDDGSVIEGLRRGDETAFARLVDHYHASLGRVARLSGKADAVTQCAFGFTDDGVSRFASSAMRSSRIL